jgi:hypothetical protein
VSLCDSVTHVIAALITVIVARERSLFNDPAAEINELTFVIKRDIGVLNKEIEVLAAFVAVCIFIYNIPTYANYTSYQSLYHMIWYHNPMALVVAVFVMQDNLRSSAANGRHSAASNQAIVVGLKTRLATTTKSFADVLQLRTKVRSPLIPSSLCPSSACTLLHRLHTHYLLALLIGCWCAALVGAEYAREE